MQRMISQDFAVVLQSNRADYNARYAEARRQNPDLDSNVFSRFLGEVADPLVQEVARRRPERIVEMVDAVYDAGLELIGQKLAGPASGARWIEEGWKRLVVPAATLLCESPNRALGSVSNAIYLLSTTPGARPREWIQRMEELAPKCSDLASYLKAGQVAAWKAGLAHFRQSALRAAGALPESVVLEVLGAPGGATWEDLRRELELSPWYNPADPKPRRALQVVGQAGAFRGFGGAFSVPPEVVAAEEHFLVRSGEECWLLTADLFGATFHRATLEEYERKRKESEVWIKDGQVRWQDKSFEVPWPGGVTSAAINRHTLAVTSAYTHQVVLMTLD
jgi:hypothetical protein